MRIFGIFSVFLGYFLGVPDRMLARGVFFRYFSWKFRVGPSRGSVAGRGVLKGTQKGVSHFFLFRSPLGNHFQEIDFYLVWVLGRVVFSLYWCQTPAQHWRKILHPWVQEFYPVLGLGSGGRLLRHSQTPTLHWIHFSLRLFAYNWKLPACSGAFSLTAGNFSFFAHNCCDPGRHLQECF